MRGVYLACEHLATCTVTLASACITMTLLDVPPRCRLLSTRVVVCRADGIVSWCYAGVAFSGAAQSSALSDTVTMRSADGFLCS
jgi:hypothetical protein